MKLLLVFDHRFQIRPDGVVCSAKNYGYSFFAKRYLRVFDTLTILARVSDETTGPATAEPTEGPGVNVVSLGDWQGPLGLLRVGRTIRTPLNESLRTAEAVVLVAPGMLAALAQGPLVRQGRPYGVEVVGDPYDAMGPASMDHPLRPVLRWSATRQLRRLCAAAAASSYVTREALQRRYPCPAYSVGVSDVELPVTSFVDAPRPAPPRADPLTVITVGTMAQLYKAQDVLIDALASCIRTGVNLSLTLVGDGRHRAALEERAARQGVGERVSFVGALPAGEAVRHALDRADLFVLPSHQEGLPRAMLEAMARGVPCIGSNVGGIPELLPDEDLVPPGDVAALAQKLREVVGNAERLVHMSARNLETARRYGEEVLGQRRIAFYEHVRHVTEASLRRLGPL